MNCDDFQPLLDELLDGTITVEGRTRLEQHAETCATCRKTQRSALDLRRALARMPIQPARSGFLDGALAMAAQPRKNHARSDRRGYIAVALAAGLSAALVTGIVMKLAEPDTATLQNVALSLTVPETVHITIGSERALAGAQIRIVVSEGIELLGYPGSREIGWQTDLSKGVNLLALPVVAHRDGIIVAHIEHDGRSRALTVRVAAKHQPLSVLDALQGART